MYVFKRDPNWSVLICYVFKRDPSSWDAVILKTKKLRITLVFFTVEHPEIIDNF